MTKRNFNLNPFVSHPFLPFIFEDSKLFKLLKKIIWFGIDLEGDYNFIWQKTYFLQLLKLGKRIQEAIKCQNI